MDPLSSTEDGPIINGARSFVTGGEEALTTWHYAGCDGVMADKQQQQFTTWLDTDIRTTAEAISCVEKEFGVSYSDSGMHKLLRVLPLLMVDNSVQRFLTI